MDGGNPNYDWSGVTNRVSGVSTATVDRVLNGRVGVRGRTQGIVMETAHRLGYFGLPNTSHNKPVRIVFFLPDGPNSFMLGLRAHLLQEAQTRTDVSVRVVNVVGPMTIRACARN